MPEPILIDARRLLCPLPVIRVQQAAESAPPAHMITTICTDPGAMHDIPAWARIHGHQVMETRQDGREYTISIKTAADRP